MFDPLHAVHRVDLISGTQLQQHVKDEDAVDDAVGEEKCILPPFRHWRWREKGHLDGGDDRGEDQRAE